MTITINAGWWLAPLIVTAIAYSTAFLRIRAIKPSSGGDYSFGKAFDAALSVAYLAVATIVALLAWLVWALFT